MRKRFVILATVIASGAAWADEGENEFVDELVKEKGHNAWHLRIGPVMAPRVRTSISCPRVVRPSVPRNGSFASGTYGNPPPGASAGFVRRDYVDGHVYPDAGTEDPGTMIYGLTWDWGAANVPAQYSGGRVSFHTDAGRWTESYSTTSFSGGSGNDDSTDFLLGVEAMGGWTFWDNSLFDAAVDVGFRYYGSGDLSADSRYGTSVTTTRNEYRYVDSYDASGWTTVPSGSYEGTPGGPGRLLGASPDRREELLGSSTSHQSYYSSNRTKLDYKIWDLRLGPTFGWHVTDWFALRGGVYGLLGLVDATLKTDTNGSSGSFHADNSTCAPVFGMAFGLSAQVNFTDWLFLMAAIEYDWWTKSVELDAGGANAELKLSDYSVSLALGVEF